MREPQPCPTPSHKNVLLLIESESTSSYVFPAMLRLLPDVGVRHYFFWDDLTEEPGDLSLQHDVIVYSPIQNTPAHMAKNRMRDFAEHFPKAKVILYPITALELEHPMIVANLWGAGYEALARKIREHLPA